jgi:hypothetical protein
VVHAAPDTSTLATTRPLPVEFDRAHWSSTDQNSLPCEACLLFFSMHHARRRPRRVIFSNTWQANRMDRRPRSPMPSQDISFTPKPPPRFSDTTPPRAHLTQQGFVVPSPCPCMRRVHHGLIAVDKMTRPLLSATSSPPEPSPTPTTFPKQGEPISAPNARARRRAPPLVVMVAIVSAIHSPPSLHLSIRLHGLSLMVFFFFA